MVSLSMKCFYIPGNLVRNYILSSSTYIANNYIGAVNFFFLHRTGRKMTLKHLRKGDELEPLAKDDHYYGPVQVYRSFLDPIHMLPVRNILT